MASEHSCSGPALHEMTPVSISSRLVPNLSSSTPFVPPLRSDWDLLFQPMFDESLNPSTYVDLTSYQEIIVAPIPEAVAPEHAVSTGSPSSTTVDQDAPSPSNSHTIQETQTPILSHDVEEDNHDIEVAHMGNDPYFASRPDLQFAICMCARYQARLTKKHLHAVKMIFRYLKGTVHRGLWYLKDSSFALTAFADADHAGCQDTRRSTSGSIQLLGDRLVSLSSKRQKSTAISSMEAEYICWLLFWCYLKSFG
ncbi:hypothetical protein Tco_0287279 [Tanacetum coccineum]